MIRQYPTLHPLTTQRRFLFVRVITILAHRLRSKRERGEAELVVGGFLGLGVARTVKVGIGEAHGTQLA